VKTVQRKEYEKTFARPLLFSFYFGIIETINDEGLGEKDERKNGEVAV